MNAREAIRLALTLVVLTAVCGAHAQDDWPQWRGPSQNSISTATGLPTTWSEAEHIVWKTPLPSWSGGSPVILGDKVFVTSPSRGEAAASSAPAQNGEEGRLRRREGNRYPGGSELLLICISKENGDILWERELDDGNKLTRKQNDSSPSPVTDGGHVWAVTGTGAVAAFDVKGEQLWKKNLREEYGPFGQMFGYASSPLLHDGKLIMQVLHGYRTDAASYLVAFDALTGAERWREERTTDAVSESPDAYTTPTLLRHEGIAQIVVSGGDYVTGHDPETGREMWRAGGLNPKKLPNCRIIASPVVAEDIIYVPSRKKPLLALRAGGTGDVTTSRLVWKCDERGGPDVPTPVCDGQYFYMVDDRGSATCLDAKTGQVVWGPERAARGTVSASPVLADGKIYITNEDAVTVVLAAGPKYELLAINELEGSGGYTLSSLAISGSRIFMRTAMHLYCIGNTRD